MLNNFLYIDKSHKSQMRVSERGSGSGSYLGRTRMFITRKIEAAPVR